MIVDKTKLGFPLFDTTFGGVFTDRSVLCCGRLGSGKSVVAMHFLGQALADDRKALLLTNAHPHDFVIVADALGFNFADATASGQLTILEYATFIPEENASQNIMLPPDAFDELQETVEREAIQRIVFDTVLPWVTIQPVSRIQQHVYSFCHAIDRLGATTLFTMPKPVSNAAFALRHAVEGFCPVSIELHHHGETAPFALSVTKYLGEGAKISTRFPFHIEPGHGIVAGSLPAPAPAPATPHFAPYSPAPAVAAATLSADAPLPLPDLPMPTASARPAGPGHTDRRHSAGGFADAIELPGV